MEEDLKLTNQLHKELSPIVERVVALETTQKHVESAVNQLNTKMTSLETKVDTLDENITDKINNVETRISAHIENNHKEIVSALSTNSTKINTIGTTLKVSWIAATIMAVIAGWFLTHPAIIEAIFNALI